MDMKIPAFLADCPATARAHYMADSAILDAKWAVFAQSRAEQPGRDSASVAYWLKQARKWRAKVRAAARTLEAIA